MVDCRILFMHGRWREDTTVLLTSFSIPGRHGELEGIRPPGKRGPPHATKSEILLPDTLTEDEAPSCPGRVPRERAQAPQGNASTGITSLSGSPGTTVPRPRDRYSRAPEAWLNPRLPADVALRGIGRRQRPGNRRRSAWPERAPRRSARTGPNARLPDIRPPPGRTTARPRRAEMPGRGPRGCPTGTAGSRGSCLG
jgi:hypothetical protein